MEISVDNVTFSTRACATRLPFRFGAVTLTAGKIARCRLELTTEDGRRATGYSGDLLVPKWFSKDPTTSVEEDQAELLASARDAGNAFVAAEPARAFDVWWSVYGPRVADLPPSTPRLLVGGFGCALVERAMIDACCRAAGVSFFEALKSDLFGFDPGAMHAPLRGWDLASDLAAAPSTRVAVRHTVGMADPLRVADIAPEDRLHDGLPQALEEDVAAYGLRWFKIKIGQGPEADARRLLSIHAVLGEVAPDYRFTVDGNEQYESIRDLTAMFDLLQTSNEGRSVLDRLAYIEQPIHRAATFDAQRNEGLDELTERIAPVILDEADGCPSALPAAIDLGYRGVSVKNCKGVFRALASRGLCRERSTEDCALFQSAEDLTNLAILPLQQDLCTISAMGLPHVERNGHHYFRGLDHLPRDEATAAFTAHDDLYREVDGGFALRIEDGSVATRSLQTRGYGYAVALGSDTTDDASFGCAVENTSS